MSKTNDTFEFEGLEVEWKLDQVYREIMFEVYTPTGFVLTDDLSDDMLERILQACWNTYWREYI